MTERERDATLCSFHALEPVKQTEPNIFQVPVRYPFQCGEFVFWNEDGRARCSPADNRNTYISGTDAVNKLFEAIASCARSATTSAELEDAARYRWFRNECSWSRRCDIVDAAGEDPSMLEHHIDKGRCGL